MLVSRTFVTYMVISPLKSLYFRLKRNNRFDVSYRHVASEFWGTGVFGDGARLTIGFAFETLGTHREGILRKSFLRHGEHHDQALWTILADEWRDTQSTCASPIIH